jgi:L-aspartate oxidase
MAPAMKRPLPIRRYLTRFETLDLPQHFTDVLVIGSGIAGLSAALAAARHGKVMLVTKGKVDECNTSYAQGGIAAAISPADSIEDHVRDTLEAAAGLAREEVVRFVIDEGTRAVRELIQIGTHFDRDETSGDFAFTREGGHQRARILHARGDQTGSEIERALVDAAQRAKELRILEDAFTIDLLTKGGACVGALIFDQRKGRQVIWSRATVLASGGCGRVFRETTNPEVATGDGLAMAFRAGAALMDMEFVQFHPTTLYVAGASRALITEAVRGEGAILIDKAGVPFMQDVHPLKDLAPRDVVSRAIVRRMRETGDTAMYLDLRALNPKRIRERFPYLASLCDSFEIDFAREPVPVRPTAHYLIGGVAADLTTRTTLARLFAAGEVACTTFHGANRLASNSLLEGLVFGTRAGHEAGLSLRGQEPIPHPELIEHGFKEAHPHAPLDLADLEQSLRASMWYHAGVERDAKGLFETLKKIRTWIRYALDRELEYPRGWELQNMLTVALLIARQALLRQESRGVHFRTDFAEKDEAKWARHTQITLEELLVEGDV